MAVRAVSVTVYGQPPSFFDVSEEITRQAKAAAAACPEWDTFVHLAAEQITREEVARHLLAHPELKDTP